MKAQGGKYGTRPLVTFFDSCWKEQLFSWFRKTLGHARAVSGMKWKETPGVAQPRMRAELTEADYSCLGDLTNMTAQSQLQLGL